MKEKKDALLLTAVCMLAVWLVLFIVAVTEGKAGNVGTAHTFGAASIICALISMGCSVVWIAMDELKKRPWVSGVISNPKYNQLKRKTAEALRWVYLDPKKQADSDKRIHDEFILFGTNCGVTYNQLEDDYKEICKAVERVTNGYTN